jgi:branched-subunit amino acid ABC-type transport system permease component
MKGVNDMKALRLAAICAVAALAGSTWAQNAPTTTDMATDTATAPPASADVGGVGNATGTGAGMQMITRQQVYQDLIHSEKSGEQARLSHDTYHGN